MDDEQTMRRERIARIAGLPFMQMSQRPGLFRGARRSFADIWGHRELLVRLVKREVKARYKDSSLGILWALVRPLAQLLIYYFAIGQIIGAARQVPDFAIFVFIGLTTWMLFSETLATATTSILNNAGLVKKVYLPREVFPLSAAGSALVNFALQSIVLVLAILTISSFRPSTDLLWVPVALITVIVYGVAAGLLLSAINVYLRDVQHFVDVYLIVFFWVSPIVYPFTFVSNLVGGTWLEQVYLANPITTVILVMQRALWTEGATSMEFPQIWPDNLELRLLITLLIGLVFLFIAQRIFARLQGNFAQEL